MKHIVYYRECTQEVLKTPIFDPNCYFLGVFTDQEISLIKSKLDFSCYTFVELNEICRKLFPESLNY